MPMFDIDGFQVVYLNGHEALESISLQAEAGEIIAVTARKRARRLRRDLRIPLLRVLAALFSGAIDALPRA